MTDFLDVQVAGQVQTLRNDGTEASLATAALIETLNTSRNELGLANDVLNTSLMETDSKLMKCEQELHYAKVEIENLTKGGCIVPDSKIAEIHGHLLKLREMSKSEGWVRALQPPETIEMIADIWAEHTAGYELVPINAKTGEPIAATPKGWQLVQIEPDHLQVLTGEAELKSFAKKGTVYRIWKAMLNDAPKFGEPRNGT